MRGWHVERLDERLRRELQLLSPPGDPSGVVDHVLRKAARRHTRRGAGTVLLALFVIAGSIAGAYGLSRVFGPGGSTLGGEPSPVAIVPHENGRIAFSLSTNDGLELHTVSENGSGQDVIPTPPGMPWLHAWSPDGTRIAVSIFPNGEGDRAIWVMNADGSDPAHVAAAENVSVPSWSPDGTTIAYSAKVGGRTEIHLVSADGSNDRIVHAEDAEGTFAVFSAKFSPDGTEILFDRGTDSGFDIFVMKVDGTDVRRLTTTGTDYDPHWAPDGAQIAFTRQEIVEVDSQARATSDIFIMNADGTDVRRLTEGGDRSTYLYPEWSPDGTKIAYLAGVTGGPGGLVVMNADGSDPVTLVEGDVLGISWQPLPAAGPSIEPAPAPSVSPEPQISEDIGLGYPVCDVTSASGVFAPGVDGTAFVATKTGDTGGCPKSGAGFQVLAVDVSGDGLADASYGPLDCDDWCSAFAAPDVDGDGIDEVAVTVGSTGGSTLFELYAVAGGDTLQRLGYDCSHCNDGTFAWGGPGGHLEGAYCLPESAYGDFVAWSAERTDAGDEYALVEIVIDVKGRFLSEVEQRDSVVPFDPSALPPGGGSDFCGYLVAVYH